MAERMFELLGAARTTYLLYSRHTLADRLKTEREGIIAELRDMRREWSERGSAAAQST
jgi:hypothetical protein